MQYTMNHAAIMALVLSQNGLRSNLRASNFEEFPGGTFPETPPVIHVYAWSPSPSHPS